VIALAAKYRLMLETGHSSAEEGLLIVRDARRQGVQHRDRLRRPARQSHL